MVNNLPEADVLYRIQSEDFGTYLELYGIEDSRVVPRLAQSESLLQQVCHGGYFMERWSRLRFPAYLQWKFISAGSPGTYSIINAASPYHPPGLNLTISPPGPNAPRAHWQVQAIYKTVKPWEVRAVQGGAFRSLYSTPPDSNVNFSTSLSFPDARGRPVFLATGGTGEVGRIISGPTNTYPHFSRSTKSRSRTRFPIPM